MYSEAQHSTSGAQAAPHAQASNSTRDPRRRYPAGERPRTNYDGVFSCRIRTRQLRHVTADYVYSEGQDSTSGAQTTEPHADARYVTVTGDRADYNGMFISNMRAALLTDVTADYVYREGQTLAFGGSAVPHTDPSYVTVMRASTNRDGMFICKIRTR